MERMMRLIIRAVVIELTRHGIRGTINAVSRRREASQNSERSEGALDQGDEKGRNIPAIDQRAMRRRLRMMRGRF